MADEYHMKIRTGHTEPIDFYLKRPDKSVVDVSSAANIEARGRIKGKKITKFQKTLTLINTGTDGGVRLTPAAADFDTKGIYEVEIKINDISGAEGDVFTPDPFLIKVEEAFADV